MGGLRQWPTTTLSECLFYIVGQHAFQYAFQNFDFENSLAKSSQISFLINFRFKDFFSFWTSSTRVRCSVRGATATGSSRALLKSADYKKIAFLNWFFLCFEHRAGRYAVTFQLIHFQLTLLIFLFFFCFFIRGNGVRRTWKKKIKKDALPTRSGAAIWLSSCFPDIKWVVLTSSKINFRPQLQTLLAHARLKFKLRDKKVDYIMRHVIRTSKLKGNDDQGETFVEKNSFNTCEMLTYDEIVKAI